MCRERAAYFNLVLWAQLSLLMVGAGKFFWEPGKPIFLVSQIPWGTEFLNLSHFPETILKSLLLFTKSSPPPAKKLKSMKMSLWSTSVYQTVLVDSILRKWSFLCTCTKKRWCWEIEAQAWHLVTATHINAGRSVFQPVCWEDRFFLTNQYKFLLGKNLILIIWSFADHTQLNKGSSLWCVLIGNMKPLEKYS